MLLDAHCHIASLSSQEKERIFCLKDAGYVFIDSSINLKTTLESCSFSRQYIFIYSALGFHPFFARGFNPHILSEYKRLIECNKKVIAIGEIGLDEKAEANLEEQENIFRIFLKLAQEVNLPVAIHNRLKGHRALSILDDYYPSYEKVIFHCFSYGIDFLKKILAKSGYVSFSLNILRKKKDILESLKECPLQNILLETDSPYMKIGENPSTPFDIKEVYSFISTVKGVEIKDLENIVLANAQRVFSRMIIGSN
jgi:TatD DNase family protein